jgi:hypothetical protein
LLLTLLALLTLLMLLPPWAAGLAYRTEYSAALSSTGSGRVLTMVLTCIPRCWLGLVAEVEGTSHTAPAAVASGEYDGDDVAEMTELCETSEASEAADPTLPAVVMALLPPWRLTLVSPPPLPPPSICSAAGPLSSVSNGATGPVSNGATGPVSNGTEKTTSSDALLNGIVLWPPTTLTRPAGAPTLLRDGTR